MLLLTVDKICLAIFVDGLDEFDTRPPDVVKLVESLASTDRHVKICVASRLWIEFDDACRDVPNLQMHQHTANDDMAVFVRERFRPCRGFSDFQHAYPTETTELLNDVHEKSNGVFIWLKIMIDALILSVTEGCGIRDLQEIVASLPSDINDLYNSLWARTPEKPRKRGAMLLRLSATGVLAYKLARGVACR